jgi:methionyl-tRNA synthetase
MSTHPRLLVTSALPYANGAIHFGHLAGAYLPADIYVRSQRLRGRDVVYICGSDEHGVSILISAGKEGVAPQDIIDRYHTLNKAAFDGVGISFDNYSRTSLPVHHETAREWFLDFHDRGLLRSRTEKQLFDEKAGMFLPDRFVLGTCPHCGFERAYGDQCENCSKYYEQTELLQPRSLLSGEVPVVREAVHWYFPLGEFQERLEAYIEQHSATWKETVLQQVRSWLKAGLSDRPITRDMEWGVRVPLEGADSKVLYVWFEAVLGYISSTKEWAERRGTPDAWKEYWCDPATEYIAFIGKDNIVFHCLMFPAMLMARGGHVLPANVPANEFLNLEGRKFSKSQNWSIEIQDFLERYPPDPLRYTLAMSMPELRDSDFYWREFQARNNNELADILGNFINRTMQFAQRTFGGVAPPAGELLERDHAFLDEFRHTADTVADLYDRFRFKDGVQATMNLARACNKYFNDEEPWKTAKTDSARCATTINCCLQACHALSILIHPILPFTSSSLRRMLSLAPDAPMTWEAAWSHRLADGHRLGEPALLFRKIDDAEIAAEVARLGAQESAPQPARDYLPVKDQIGIEQFGAVDLRVAVITAAERVPKSDKLLRLQVDLGFETRQIVAGIGKAYAPEDLVGRSVVVVANLKPAKLMGVESQGMVLAATNDDGVPILLTPASEVHPGAGIK